MRFNYTSVVHENYVLHDNKILMKPSSFIKAQGECVKIENDTVSTEKTELFI